ncbi:hypothetical protein M406DRAFT_107592 [Cryphonectria parasitica EP155]|uniref:Rhodopsin domain-containing protein n=1 Tax=Cryphonectria parasitica (strain ATCC 38755 / EP155) TaxID=660469 RepID=A0A9P5CT65_CRYP1|nr:uncharacterized protein M406DRAFT_107592 [Cryphonectria parasitica EP155]KAF3768830.1 hypothetical protein M406DRAFT_107592 [Cryphonectria parasitica EP155]
MKPGANAGGILAVASIAIVVGTLAVALRLYTRKFVLNQIWLDDYLAVVSWACLIALAIQNFHAVSTGLGSHFDQIPPSGYNAFFKDLWLGLVIYNITLLFTKLTLFFQFYRVIRQTSWGGLKMFNACAMSIIAAWQFAQIFVQVFACVPVEAAWDQTVKGVCQSILVTRTMNSVGNIVTDFIILLLPLPIIWRLALPRKSKYAVIGIFSLGFFTCIVSILRITLTPTGESDIAFQTVSVIAWTTAEVLTGVIIASLSTMRPLMSRYVSGFTTRGTSKATSATSRSRASYGMQNLYAKGTPGTSRADRRSMLASPARRFSGGGWLDLSESDREDMARHGVAGLRMPDLARLEPGIGRHGSIRVTKEWSVRGET